MRKREFWNSCEKRNKKKNEEIWDMKMGLCQCMEMIQIIQQIIIIC